jgi:16S rRNA (guanine966-N2)-methyltransferase
MAFFNIVGSRVEGARFLDLFAGSGVFSFEAVSRGAASAIAIEKDRHATAAIDALAGEWNAAVTTVTSDVFAGIGRVAGTVFDLVYADPPYAFGRYDDLLAVMDKDLQLAPDAIVAIEHQRRSEPFTRATDRLVRGRRAEYGEVWITFFEVARHMEEPPENDASH